MLHKLFFGTLLVSFGWTKLYSQHLEQENSTKIANNADLNFTNQQKKFPLNEFQIEILTDSLMKRMQGAITVEELIADKKVFSEYLLSDPYQLAYFLAKANDELFNACVTDDLHVANGGNSFRKAGAVRVSKVIELIDLDSTITQSL